MRCLSQNGGHAHVFCSSVHLSSWIKTVSSTIESFTFQTSRGDEQLQDQASFDQEKQGLVYVIDRRNFNHNPSQKSLNHIKVHDAINTFLVC